MISVHKMENMEIGVWIIFYLITCLFALSSGVLAHSITQILHIFIVFVPPPPNIGMCLERLCVNTALHTLSRCKFITYIIFL